MKTKLVPDPLASLVDELGALETELLPLKFKIARVEALRKSLRESFANSPADATHIVDGEKYSVLVGAKSLESSINILKLARLVGYKTFQLLASVSLKALDLHTPTIKAEVVSVARTGARTLTILAAGK